MHIYRIVVSTPSGYELASSLEEATNFIRKDINASVLAELEIELSDEEIVDAVSCFIDNVAK